MERKHAFAPAVRSDARVLVLGSLPGEASLQAAQYYAHPQNRFWHFLSRITAKDLISLSYDQRLTQMMNCHIGVWDVIASATRKGSLDTAIREAKHASLANLVATLPALQAVAFNGKAAAKIGQALLTHTGLDLLVLPSSSPANAGIPLPEKERQWDQLRKYLT